MENESEQLIELSVHLQSFSGTWYFDVAEKDRLVSAIDNKTVYQGIGILYRTVGQTIEDRRITLDFAQIPISHWSIVSRSL